MAKLLLFSDLHCDLAAARSLVQRSAGFDLALGAGDFATLRRGLPEIIAALRPMQCPTVLVPGNSESREELEAACQNWSDACVLHGCGATVAGIAVYGIGGGIPVTPFGAWSYDFTEQEAESLLADCPPGVVLVSHSPPRGTLDLDSNGRSLGSEVVRQAVLKLSPSLLVCGHIHASWEKSAVLGTTPVVNAGPRGITWDLEEVRENLP